jgi:putative nucleotidyltransferase with HDIG domain
MNLVSTLNAAPNTSHLQLKGALDKRAIRTACAKIPPSESQFSKNRTAPLRVEKFKPARNLSIFPSTTESYMSDDRRVMFVGEDSELWPELLRCSTRENWRMTFAHAAEEALAALDEQDFDAVVSNLSLNKMSGTDFLHEIRERKPAVWRFLRAKPGATHDIKGWAGAADQLIEVPLAAEAIQNRLEQAFNKGFWRPSSVAQSLLAGCPVLPTPPRLYHRMMEMIASPNVSLEKIGAVIEEDPAMAAKVLRLVNSAVFALRMNVTRASEAVMYLGLETTKAMILIAHTMSAFSAVERVNFPMEKLLKHVFTTARYARWISRVECPRGQTPDQAFTAGLLHDIGKLLLAANQGEAYARCIEYARKENLTLRQAERDFFGANHAELGGALLAAWGLPQPIVEAVALHHAPEWIGSCNSFNAVTAVHAANVFAQEDEAATEGLRPASLDFDYLNTGGFLDSIDSWRETCRLRE